MVRSVRKKQTMTCKRRRKTGGFLYRYDFAFVSRNTVNTAMKGVENLRRKLMKQFSNEVNRISQQRIQQIIDQGGQNVEKIAPKIIRSAIEEVYQTPFRLLGSYRKPKLNQLKRNVDKGLKSIKRYV